jgi:hypothetical protein
MGAQDELLHSINAGHFVNFATFTKRGAERTRALRARTVAVIVALIDERIAMAFAAFAKEIRKDPS